MAEASEMTGHHIPSTPSSTVVFSSGLSLAPADIAAAVSKRGPRTPSSSSRIQKKSSTGPRRPSSKQAFSPHTNSLNLGPARSHSSTMQPSGHGSHGQQQHLQQQPAPQSQGQDAQSSATYTRTGRLSKAKKGKKVHTCEECGKVYSRAEHLRRHQQNHNPPPLKCTFPGCGKLFYRQDLLDRHRERHENGESGMGSDDQGSGSSPRTTAAELYSTGPATSTVAGPSVDVSTGISDVSQAQDYPAQMAGSMGSMSAPLSREKPYPNMATTSRPSVVSISGESTPAMPGTVWDEPMSNPQYSSPSEVASPTREYNPQLGYEQLYRPRIHSEPSISEHPWQMYSSISRSPSINSPAMPAYWNESQHKSPAPPMSVSPEMSGGQFTPRGSMTYPPGDAMHFMQFQYPAYRSYADRDRDESLALFGQPSLGTGLHQVQQERYLEAYMRNFHPSYPVVHGQAINMQEDCPLLKAAMIAIGASYADERMAKDTAKQLHERCLRALQRREQDIPQPPRLCDQQAVFLIEAFKQFRGRRASPQTSKQFNELYHSLATDPEITTARPLRNLEAQLSTSANSGTVDEQTLYQQWVAWIQLASRQRLLQSCFMLEMQQAIFLVRANGVFSPHISGLQLPFPSSHALFASPTPDQWLFMYRRAPQSAHDQVYEALQDLPLPSTTPPYDPFQSMLLIAANLSLALSTDATSGNQAPGSADHQLPPRSLDPQTHTQIAHYTSVLIRQVPLRALLAVAGESWLPLEKLSHDAYQSAKTELGNWLAPFSALSSPASAASAEPDAATSVYAAVGLSLHIIRLAVESDPTSWGAPGAELGVYFAALVLWAVTVRPVGSNPAAGANVPLPSPTTTDIGGLRDAVRVFVQWAADARVDFAALAGSLGVGAMAGQQHWWKEGVVACLTWLKGRFSIGWPGTLGEVSNQAIRVLEGVLSGSRRS